jgi:uncharacterized protein YuzE
MAEATKSDLEHAQRLFATERAGFTRRVLEANRESTLAERAVQLGASLEYDAEEDALYITVGSTPDIAVTHQVRDGVYVQVVPETLRVVGLEVRHFAEAAAREGYVKDLFGNLSAAIIHLKAFHLDPSSPGARAMAEDLDRVLVP